MLALVLAVRFALELALLAASAWSGYNLVGGGPPGWTVGALCAVVVASFWGVLLSPKARVTLPPAARNLVEVAVFVLVASASELLRFDGAGQLLWRRSGLGIDGVVIHRVQDGEIFGDAEWDPPGGWKSFRLRLDSGEICQS